MNPNYTHTITLYNRIRASDRQDKKEYWKRTVLHNCFYKMQTSVGYQTTQASVSNTYVVRIPKRDDYLPYESFCKKLQGFTLSIDDIVVYGECNDEITGNYAVEFLRQHKPNAFKVTAVADNTIFRMGKHYRLGG